MVDDETDMLDSLKTSSSYKTISKSIPQISCIIVNARDQLTISDDSYLSNFIPATLSMRLLKKEE